MAHIDQKVLVSMVVDGSAPLTQLHFCPLDGTCVMGTGLEFLVAQLGDKSFRDLSARCLWSCSSLRRSLWMTESLTHRGEASPSRPTASSFPNMEQTVARYSQKQCVQFLSVQRFLCCSMCCSVWCQLHYVVQLQVTLQQLTFTFVDQDCRCKLSLASKARSHSSQH